MPGQDQYVKLPDGSYVHVPGSATPQQLSQLRDKLSSLQPNLKTGQGMEAAAHQQATPKPGELPGVASGAPPTGNAGTAQAPLVTPQGGESFTDTMRRGAEMGKRVTPMQSEIAKNTAEEEAPLVIGAASAPAAVTGILEAGAAGVPGLLRLGKTAAMAYGGGKIGSKAGEKIGGFIAPDNPEASRALSFAGGLGGGAAGGLLSSALETSPLLSRIANESTSRLSPSLADTLFPNEEKLAAKSAAQIAAAEKARQTELAQWERLRNQDAASQVPAAPPKPVDPVREAVRQGIASRVPTKMPTPPAMAVPPKGVIATVDRPQTQGFVPRVAAPPAPDIRFVSDFEQPQLPSAGTPESVAGTRSLILTPSEAASEKQMQGIATQFAKRRGMQFAAGMTPREGRSVPRLPTQMQAEELPGPREVIHFPNEDDEPEQ